MIKGETQFKSVGDDVRKSELQLQQILCARWVDLVTNFGNNEATSTITMRLTQTTGVFMRTSRSSFAFYAAFL